MRIVKLLKAAKSVVSSGPLVQDGWVRSYVQGQSVDREGKPIPWITYSALDFLAERLPSVENLFEYGSGNSTHWWAARSTYVRSVEHDAEWFKKVKKEVPANVELLYRELDNGGSYENAILVDKRLYDVIVIDGRHRNKCMVASEKRIKPNGILLLDNSDRPDYQTGMQYLSKCGFRKLPFSGLCPIVNFKSQTSVFYRPHNILGI